MGVIAAHESGMRCLESGLGCISCSQEQNEMYGD